MLTNHIVPPSHQLWEEDTCVHLLSQSALWPSASQLIRAWVGVLDEDLSGI